MLDFSALKLGERYVLLGEGTGKENQCRTIILAQDRSPEVKHCSGTLEDNIIEAMRPHFSSLFFLSQSKHSPSRRQRGNNSGSSFMWKFIQNLKSFS